MTKFVTEDGVIDAECCYECWQKVKAALESGSACESNGLCDCDYHRNMNDDQAWSTLP